MPQSRMWVPTIYLVNQKDAKIIDVSDRNVFVYVCPGGDVYYSFRYSVMLWRRAEIGTAQLSIKFLFRVIQVFLESCLLFFLRYLLLFYLL